jgi:hypothetical protein
MDDSSGSVHARILALSAAAGASAVGTTVRERIPHCAPSLQVVTCVPRYPELAPVSIDVTNQVANWTYWTFRRNDGIHRCSRMLFSCQSAHS